MVLVMLPIGWLNSSVNNPFTIAYAFLFCVAIVFFFDGIYQIIMVALLLGVIMIMTLLTFIRPELFMIVDNSVQLMDSLIQIPLTFIAVVLMVRTFSKANRNNLKLLKIKNTDLLYVTLHDELTGIYNRRYIFQRLSEMKNSKKSKVILIGMIDIDDFKRINDNYGHEDGDSLLIETANFIHNLINSFGFVGRYGGDEFIIIIENENERIQVEFFTQLKLFSEKMHQQTNRASFSGGFVRCNTDENLNSYLAKADKFLYEAKKEGKNRFCIDGEIL